MKRVGIFGGTFNPVHLGHLLVAQAVLETVGLDKVLWVPCQLSPFKKEQERAGALAESSHRLEMVRRSVEGNPCFDVCDIEVRRKGVSYTIDTVRQLMAEQPDTRYSLIMGMDSLLDLHRWRSSAELVALCDVVTVLRPGCERAPTSSDLGFPPAVAERLIGQVVKGRWCDISSTEIRQRVAEGLPIRYLVSPAVEAYIKEHALYKK